MKYKKLSIAFLIVLITSCGDHSIELGQEYFYYSEGKQQAVIVREGGSPSTPMIPCHVEKYSFNRRYIVARQKVVEPCFWEPKESLNYPAKANIVYWIIDKNQNLFFGPLDRIEFEETTQELAIPSNLNALVLAKLD